MSYRVDITDQHNRAAEYVDRMPRGERPGDLPVQLPTCSGCTKAVGIGAKQT
jgi:hypothetical protein